MLSTLLKALAVFAARTLPVLYEARDCGAGVSVFTINSVDLVPLVPLSGQNMTLSLDYTVPAGVTVTGGQTEYRMTYNYIPFSPSYEPLCQDIPCPLGPGTYTNSSTSVWPAGIRGNVNSQMKWLDENGKLLLCVEISGVVSGGVQPRQPESSALVLYTAPKTALRPASRTPTLQESRPLEKHHKKYFLRYWSTEGAHEEL